MSLLAPKVKQSHRTPQMKGHFGVDSSSKLIHAVTATPANVADSTVLPDLLHGRETRVWGDQAYRGQKVASVASRDVSGAGWAVVVST